MHLIPPQTCVLVNQYNPWGFHISYYESCTCRHTHTQHKHTCRFLHRCSSTKFFLSFSHKTALWCSALSKRSSCSSRQACCTSSGKSATWHMPLTNSDKWMSSENFTFVHDVQVSYWVSHALYLLCKFTLTSFLHLC
jgi:hypothetical protein